MSYTSSFPLFAAFLPSLVEYCIYRCILNRVTFVSFNTHQGSNDFHRNACYKHRYNVRPSHMPRMPHTTTRQSQRNIQPELRTKIPMLSREHAQKLSQRRFPWTEPPKHVPHDWPDCSCGVPCQLKDWNGRFTFKCWDEYGGGCNFIRGATEKPETQHRECKMCGFKLERQQQEVTENTPLSQTTPAASPSQSPRQEVPPSPEPVIARTSLFMTSPNRQPSLPGSTAMDIKQAIPITMYQTTASIVIIVHNGVTSSADANSVTLRFEGPPPPSNRLNPPYQ